LLRRSQFNSFSYSRADVNGVTFPAHAGSISPIKRTREMDNAFDETVRRIPRPLRALIWFRMCGRPSKNYQTVIPCRRRVSRPFLATENGCRSFIAERGGTPPPSPSYGQILRPSHSRAFLLARTGRRQLAPPQVAGWPRYREK
jgi:hypothetical protein